MAKAGGGQPFIITIIIIIRSDGRWWPRPVVAKAGGQPFIITIIIIIRSGGGQGRWWPTFYYYDNYYY